MKTRITTVVACFLVISCSFEKKEEGSSKQNYSLVEELNDNFDEDATSAPTMGYYAKHNILLLDSTKEVFYHDHYFSCGTGFSPGDPPRSVDLTQGQVIAVDSTATLINIIATAKNTPRLTVIATDVDTISSQKYFDLVTALLEIDQCFLLKKRRITLDERAGITATKKKENAPLKK